MTTPKLESAVEIKVVNWAKKNGFLTPKVRFSEAGWPDRLFIAPNGAHMYIEFKRVGERPRTLQYHRMSQLRQRGVFADWTDSEIQAISWLKEALTLEDTNPVEPQSVPDSGNEASSLSDSSGVILGSRSGEDEHRVVQFPHPERAGDSEEDAHSSAPSPVL